jgi:hypothetical protein
LGFFDFIADLPHYHDHTAPVPRMNKRFEALIEPNKDVILGAKVLDLASHDGRWCYAFAGAGRAIKAVPSFSAMDRMAEALDFNVKWVDWDARAKDDRRGVSDYYREEKMRRGTCVLRPNSPL